MDVQAAVCDPVCGNAREPGRKTVPMTVCATQDKGRHQLSPRPSTSTVAREHASLSRAMLSEAATPAVRVDETLRHHYTARTSSEHVPRSELQFQCQSRLTYEELRGPGLDGRLFETSSKLIPSSDPACLHDTDSSPKRVMHLEDRYEHNVVDFPTRCAPTYYPAAALVTPYTCMEVVLTARLSFL